MAKRTRQQAPPQRLILDAGAVIALSRADPRARAALEAGADVSIPAVVADEAGGAVILTGDPEDLRALAGDRPGVVIRAL